MHFSGPKWSVAGCVLACSITTSPLTVEAEPFVFTNVTAAAGITHSHSHPATIHPHGFTDNISWMSGGAVADDFDRDGMIDLYVLQGGASPNLLYMNQSGGTFTNEAALRGADITAYGMGASAADYDNDGDADILFTVRNGQPVLLENNGSGFFSVATGIVDSITLQAAMSPSWGDINNDGLLDLALSEWVSGDQGLYLLGNTGTALQLIDFRQAPPVDEHMFSPRFADLNGDRRSDLPAVADFVKSQLYLNAAANSFLRVTSDANIGFEESGMGSAIGDYDNDGDLDWFASSIFSPTGFFGWTIGNRLYRNDGRASFTDVTESSGVKDGGWGWGSTFGDLDNDGDLDLYHVNGWPDYYPRFLSQPARLFENLGNGSFTNMAAGSGAADDGQGRGVLLFDFDDDGDQDIFICNNMDATPRSGQLPIYEPGTPALLRNDTVTSNHWLRVTLEGTPPLHRDGIGSRVYLTTGTNTQMRELHASTGFQSQGPGRIAHFGLGTNMVADVVRAEWNSGDAVVRFDIAADQAVSLPSAKAALSARRIVSGQSVTASAAGTTNPVEWVVGGVTNADPVTATFTNVGTHELVLNVRESGSMALLYQEVLRVEVLEFAPMTSIEAISPGGADIGWQAVSGELHRIETCTDLSAGAWAIAVPPVVATNSGIQSATFTNAPSPSSYYRGVNDPGFPWPDPDPDLE